MVPSRGSTQHLKDALQDGNLKKVIAKIVKDQDVDLVYLKFKNKSQEIVLQPPRFTSVENLKKLLQGKMMRRVLADIERTNMANRVKVKITDEPVLPTIYETVVDDEPVLPTIYQTVDDDEPQTPFQLPQLYQVQDNISSRTRSKTANRANV